MTRIRKKTNKPGAATKGGDETSKKKGSEPAMFAATDKPTGAGGFTEQDIEFMKKAI